MGRERDTERKRRLKRERERMTLEYTYKWLDRWSMIILFQCNHCFTSFNDNTFSGVCHIMILCIYVYYEKCSGVIIQTIIL